MYIYIRIYILADIIDTADYTIFNENEAMQLKKMVGQLRQTSVCPPMTKSCRQNAQRSKQTDKKTGGGGRQANQMAIRHQQMRPPNRHLWLVNGVSGKQPHNSPNTGVRFADKTYLDLKKFANKFTF